MPENRKYLPEEINYVLSRILAGWKPEAIAEGFKRDHPYWKCKEFTKKQVTYIRNTYKIPPGAIRPFEGPVLPKQESLSPLSKLLIMKAPPNDAAVPEQPQNNQADNLASSYNNDNMSEYFDAQSDFNTTDATGHNTAQSFGTQAISGFDQNVTTLGGNDENMGFDDPNAAGGVMGTQPDGNANHGDSIDNATHGVGDQFNLNNATNADLPAFTAEDKAFMDELLPAIEALAETGENEQHVAQEDIVMQSIEDEPITDNGEQTQTRAQTQAQARAWRAAAAAKSKAAVLTGFIPYGYVADLPEPTDTNTTIRRPVPPTAPTLCRDQRDRKYQFFFRPHNDCQINGVHVHLATGEILFRSVAHFNEVLDATMRNQTPESLIRLANQIQRDRRNGTQTKNNGNARPATGNARPATGNTRPANGAGTGAATRAGQAAAPTTNRQSNLSYNPNSNDARRTGASTTNTNTTQPTRPAWQRGNTNYYNVYTGNSFDYQGINPAAVGGTTRPSTASYANQYGSIDFDVEFDDIGYLSERRRLHQMQQNLYVPGLNPAAMAYTTVGGNNNDNNTLGGQGANNTSAGPHASAATCRSGASVASLRAQPAADSNAFYPVTAPGGGGGKGYVLEDIVRVDPTHNAYFASDYHSSAMPAPLRLSGGGGNGMTNQQQQGGRAVPRAQTEGPGGNGNSYGADQRTPRPGDGFHQSTESDGGDASNSNGYFPPSNDQGQGGAGGGYFGYQL